MKSLFYGTLALDDIDLPSVSIRGIPGGSGVFGTLAASIFCDTGIVSVLGSDFPKEFLKKMEKKGVNTAVLQRSKKLSFRWGAKYSDDLSEVKTVNRELNALEDFDPSKLKKIDDVKAVFVSKNSPLSQKGVFNVVPKKAIKILESRGNWITNERTALKKVLKEVDIFFVNEEELGLLVQKDLPIPEMMERVMLLGPKIIVFKRGEHGLVMYGKYGTMIVPSYPLTYAIDPTGAGDSLAGSLVGILGCMGELNEKNMKTALVLASTVSSFVVEDYGTASLEELTLNEVINRASMYLGQLPSLADLRVEKVEKRIK